METIHTAVLVTSARPKPVDLLFHWDMKGDVGSRQSRLIGIVFTVALPKLTGGPIQKALLQEPSDGRKREAILGNPPKPGLSSDPLPRV